jgi:hypothetical protein
VNFLHTEFEAGPSDAVVVTLAGQANVMLLDSGAFAAYRAGQPYRYRGGWAARSPVRLLPQRQGRWHVVVDLGGYAGTVRAGVRILRGRNRNWH